jgi:hypothetical protein
MSTGSQSPTAHRDAPANACHTRDANITDTSLSQPSVYRPCRSPTPYRAARLGLDRGGPTRHGSGMSEPMDWYTRASESNKTGGQAVRTAAPTMSAKGRRALPVRLRRSRVSRSGATRPEQCRRFTRLPAMPALLRSPATMRTGLLPASPASVQCSCFPRSAVN